MKYQRLLLLVAVLFAFAVGARAQNGIPSDGRDYYMAFFQPSLTCSNTSPFQQAFVLVSAFYDTRVEINYFDENTGKEINAGTYTVLAKQFKQIPIDPSFTRTKYPNGGVPEYKAIHVHANSPVNCTYYSTGPGWGGMYLGLPTGALGKHYVATTYAANPAIGHNNSWYGCPVDSSSSVVAVIAIVDNTHVTISPNATSLDGHVGKSTGTNARGFEQPFQVTLQRGQVYVLKSQKDDETIDMSGSVIDADQPVGVLAGQENAHNGETQFVDRGGDQRDVSVEMMVPVEYWTTDGYMAAPMMDSPGSTATDPSIGDMFKIFTYDTTGTKVDFWDAGSGRHTYQVSRMPADPPTIHNVMNGINVRSQDGQKIFVEQYDYRLQTTTEPFPAPSQMNVVPAARWRHSYMWSVPDDKNQVHKRRYINVIAKSSLLISKIKYYKDGIGPKPITSLTAVGSVYTIPNTGGQFVARRFEISPGAFYATSDSAFGLSQYGDLGLDPDNDLGDNDGDDFYFSYASPVGQIFAIDGALRPKLTVDTFCSSWKVHVRDVYALDGGIAQLDILNDPLGVLKRKPGTDSGYISINAGFDPGNFTIIPGDTVVDATVKVLDPLHDAEVWLWALNTAGNDTLIHLLYKAPDLKFGRDYAISKIDSAAFMRIPLGQDSCSQFVLKNTGAPGSKSFVVTGADFVGGGQGVFRVSGTIPALPTTLKPGDSVIIQMCFETNTPAHVFLDTLRVTTDCPEALARVIGSSTYPTIYATDWDFGNVTVGKSKTHTVNVKNTGSADLLLTKNWVMPFVTNKQFTFEDSARLPLLLHPNESVDLNFSFHPNIVGADSSRCDWGTNLVPPFEHAEKDYSLLWGKATAPGLQWDRPVDSMKTICDAPVQDTVHLLNPTDVITGQHVIIDSVVIHGPTASEWTIIRNQIGYTPLNDFEMKVGDDIWVLVGFNPDLSKPLATRYMDRQDTLWAYNKDSIEAYVVLLGHVDAADLIASSASVDLGTVQPGQTTGTKTVTITNPGTAPLTIKSISIDNADFHIVSGPAVGDVILPGESRDVLVNATVNTEGSSNATLNISGETNCPPLLAIALTAGTQFVAVQGTGHDYTPTYVCRKDSYDVTVRSTGTDTVQLKSIEIVDDPSMPGASSEFHFTDGSRKLIVDQKMDRGTPYTYPVVFEPTLVQASKAIVRYTFDTARHQGVGAWTADQPLTGPGIVEHQILTAAKNDAVAAEHYMATTADVFEVPVRFTQALPGAADATRLQFDFTFRRDLFHWNKTLDGNGYTVSNVSAPKVNGDLETRTITVVPTSGGTFTGADELLRVSFQLMVARDTNSDFIVSNAMYTDSKGNDICYILHQELPGAFMPVDLCGNAIIRRFEQTGRLTYSIREVTPNPASSTADVTLDVRKDKTPISIELYDALGHRLFTKTSTMSTGLNKTVLDLTQLSSGEYTVRVASANGVIQSKKLLIQK